MSTLEHSERPWGSYQVLLEETHYKVKKICVKPGGRLSLQRHKHRSEHWYIVEGKARVHLNDQLIELEGGKSIDIPKGGIHRIENYGTTLLVFIEVQQGEYLGEDDIERLSDDYGRVAQANRI